MDAIDFLLGQHEQIRIGFREVAAAEGTAKVVAFADLRRLLAVHETAEQLVLHARTRHLPGGGVIAAAVMDEEKHAKQLLAELEDLEPASALFSQKLQQLADAVEAHAQHEEMDEFPLVRARLDADELATMTRSLEAAERAAPTHPHPTVNSPLGHILFGPIDSIVDHIRDAVGKH
jgi:porphobilinogen deaminase